MMETHYEVLDAIRSHGSAAYPEECCGFLLGKMAEAGNYVAATVRVANRRQENRARRFTIAAEDFRRADKAARKAGWDIVGFYHSHPDHPARPSDTDLAEATFPGYTYVIVSVRKSRPEQTTAWSLQPDRLRFQSEPIRITPERIPTP